MIPRVIAVPQTAVVMDACDFFALLISCSGLRACVSLAWEPVLQRNYESPIYGPLRIGVAAPPYIVSTGIGCVMRIIARILLVVLLLSLPFMQTLFAGQPKETKRVLVLYSEDKAHPAHELTDQGIRSAFRSNTLFDVQLYEEYLDVTRFRGPANAQAFADYLRRKYAGIKIDTIITVYPAAADFLLREAFDVLPGTPIVASQVSRAYAAMLKESFPHRAITGTVMGDNASGVLDAAIRMRPGTRRAAIVAGTAPNNVYSELVFRKGIEPYQEKIEPIDLTRLSMGETLTRVGSLPPDTIVLYASISSDGEGRSFVAREALADIARAANAPVFGLYDSFMGFGIVGGRLVSWEQQGKEAAGMALRVMRGEPAASIPFGGEQAYVDLYDWRELKRWNIPESAVPAGSEIRFREPSRGKNTGKPLSARSP